MKESLAIDLVESCRLDLQFRGMLYVTPTSCPFYSKRGLVLKQFAGLREEVRDQLRAGEAILDGKLIGLAE